MLSKYVNYSATIKDTNFIAIAPYAGSHTPILHQCKICNNRYKIAPIKIIYRKIYGCKYCHKKNILKWNTDMYINNLKEKDIHIIPIEPYINMLSQIQHKCLVCNHIWKVIPKNIIKQYSGCPVCFKKRQQTSKMTNSDYVIALSKIHPTIINVDAFINKNTALTHKCTKCGYTFKKSPKEMLKAKIACAACDKPIAYSKSAIGWLTAIAKHNAVNIKHKLNGGEYRIKDGNKTYIVDGYDDTTHTVYEFLGDKFHGNLEVFNKDDKCCPYNKSITAKELYDITFSRLNRIKELGYVVMYIWERDYINHKTPCQL